MLEQGQLQRRSVRGAQSDVFGAPRVRIYPPSPGAAQRGVSVRSCPEWRKGRVYVRLSAARVGSGGRGAHSPVRCSGGGYVTPAAGSAGAHRGAKLGCVFVNGGNATKTDIAMQHCREFVGLRTSCGRYVPLSRNTATQKNMSRTFVFCVRKFVPVQGS
jgi:hypothetical protein